MNRRRVNLIADNGLLILAILAVSILPWYCWQDSLCHTLVPAWFSGRAEDVMQGWHSYDRQFLSAAGDGNVALRFIDFDAHSDKHVDRAQAMACRGAYALYPHHVWAAPEETIWNNGRDIINIRFDPSIDWLHAHDVRTVVEHKATSDDRILVRAMPVPPATLEGNR